MSTEQQAIDLQAISESQFLERFGGLYEHSVWIAEAVWKDIASANSISVEEFIRRLQKVVDTAAEEQKLDLLRAHPELAGRAAVQGDLTPESTDEQSRARLDLCTETEFAKFHQLNSAYNAKFEFPFIMAVRNSSREEILAAFEKRLNNSRQQEFDTALQQVHQIARLRLQAAITSDSA